MGRDVDRRQGVVERREGAVGGGRGKEGSNS